jgi:hypothetical protein
MEMDLLLSLFGFPRKGEESLASDAEITNVDSLVILIFLLLLRLLRPVVKSESMADIEWN